METLSVPGTLDSLSAIGRYVMAAAAEAALSPKAAYLLRLAVDEIATNIVTHGYQERARHGDLQIAAIIDERGLTMTIEDTAPPYDPARVQSAANVDRPLDERPIGGLGLYLAVRSVDQFQYERVGDRNRHTLFVQRIASGNG